MSGKKVIRDKDTVEQKREDEKRGWVADEQPELRRSVEQEIQGKVDTNHPDGRLAGMTLEAEERFRAQENEIRSTRQRMDRQQTSGREERTREVISAQTRYAQEEPPEDPREDLSREQLAEVN